MKAQVYDEDEDLTWQKLLCCHHLNRMLYSWLGLYFLICKFKLQKCHGLPDVLNEIQCF